MNRNSTEQENQTYNSESSLQLQSQNFKYGRYLFKNQLKQYLESAQVYKEEIKEKLKRESLQIKNQSKYNEIWVKIFVNIISAKICQFDYRNNNNPNIIKEISLINFKQLKTLYLHQNNINNIEVLPIINCQKLQDLCLDRNQISRISCMKKWSHSNLCWFALAKNPIHQIHSYAKMKFRKVIIFLRLEQSYDQNIICEDLGILLKLDNQIIQIIHNQGRKRLFQPKIKSMIKLRHQKIEI